MEDILSLCAIVDVFVQVPHALIAVCITMAVYRRNFIFKFVVFDDHYGTVPL